MKTKIISPLKKELLIIEWQDDYEIVGQVLFGNSEQKGVLKTLLNLEGYTLLGSPDEIKEETIIDLVQMDNWTYGKPYYTNYRNNDRDFPTALESFNSALENEIYWVNPLGAEIPDFDTAGLHIYDFLELKENWHEAQEKTFDRNRVKIFVEN